MKNMPLTEVQQAKLDSTFLSSDTRELFRERWNQNDLGRAFAEKTDVFRRQECTIQEALQFHLETTDTDRWIRTLLAPKQGVTIGALSRRVRSLCYPLASNIFKEDSSNEDMFRLFGVIEVLVPPDLIYLHMISHIDEVAHCYNAEAFARASVIELSDRMTIMELHGARKMIIGDKGLPEAFDNVSGEGVVVGILDSGVDADHPDLAEALIAYRDFTPECNIQERAGRDCYGQGTHVAGIALGRGNASYGTHTGIAKQAGMLSAKVLNADGMGSISNILAGLRWLIDHEADIIHVGLGVYNSPLRADGTSILTQACAATASQGIIVCVAAGNEGPEASTIVSPADDPGVLTVGAVNTRGEVSDFSSRGPCKNPNRTVGKPDIVAPGENILSARSKSCTWAPYPSNHYYAFYSGTSMASSLVTGATALLLSGCRRLAPGRDLRGAIQKSLVAKAAMLNGTDLGILDLGAAALALEKEIKTGGDRGKERENIHSASMLAEDTDAREQSLLASEIKPADERQLKGWRKGIRWGRQKIQQCTWQGALVIIVATATAFLCFHRGSIILNGEKSPIANEKLEAAESICLEGWQALQENDMKATKRAFSKAIEQNPWNGKYYFHLGLLLSDQGEPFDDWKIWMEGIARDPGCAELKNILKLNGILKASFQ